MPRINVLLYFGTVIKTSILF